MTYQEERESTLKALDELRASAFRLEKFSAKKDRYVIFSDIHRCDKKGNDDFKTNEFIYCYALSIYFQKGYTLILNGDIEEGFEGDYEKITEQYKDTVYSMERKFVEGNRYVRIYGNHDIEWENEENINTYLRPYLGNIKVHEGVMLGDKILILHGHQGDPKEKKGAWFGKCVVRYIWRPLQRCGLTDTLWPLLEKFNLVCDRAAINNIIRRKRDEFMYEWAQKNKMLVIAGHTHRAMFKSFSKIGQIQKKIDRINNMEDTLSFQFLKPALIEKLNKIIKDSKEELVEDKKNYRFGKNPVPCYFNTGSCVYTDGITGIELNSGKIRLVKWEISESTCECKEALKRDTDFHITIERKIYQSDDLEVILLSIQEPDKKNMSMAEKR